MRPSTAAAAARQTPILVVALLLVSSSVSFRSVSAAQHTANNKDEAANKQAVEDILKDTMLLLDVLDQKLAGVQNKTPSALMRDNLRALETSHDHQAGRDSFQEMPAANEHGDLPFGPPNSSDNNNKQSRQLLDENQLASDSTERHIRFTLDLMQAVFASHSSAQRSPSAGTSGKKEPASSIDSFLISPLSIQLVLMMMHLGARGQTRRELGHSLHLAPSELGQPESVSNSGAPVKPKWRNQLTNERPTRQPQRQQQQQHQAGGGGAHEMFGSAVRNLLKDPSVLKALTSANQLFVQKNLSLAQQFEAAIKQHYAADVKMIDFQQHSPNGGGLNNVSASNNAVSSPKQDAQQQANGNSSTNNDSPQQIINEWIERQSRGRISNFLSSPVPASTLLMAINVIYFKGDWQYKFDPADTETDAWFTQANGRQVKLPMMVNRLPLAFAHDAAMRTSVIELPFKAQRLGLFLLLPDEVSGIFHTMQMLNSSSFAHLISAMRKPSHQSQTAPPDQASGGINIRIPKFSIESSPRLSQILSQQLGLKSLFAADVADLTGMFAPPSKRAPSNRTLDEHPQQPPQVGLDELIHKAVLQVDEQGGVAAATSATIVERVGSFSGNYFEADHPFLIFLMDKQTGLVLFSGVFAGTTQQQDGATCKRGHNSQAQCT